MTPASIYLILIIHGQAVWGLPQPYPSQGACDEAGAHWDSGGPPDTGTRGHYCLPAAIAAPSLFHCQMVFPGDGSRGGLVCK